MVTDSPYGVDYDPAGALPLGSSTTKKDLARWPTTIALTGAPPGRCSPVPLRTSGMPAVTPARFKIRLPPPVSRCAPRSSGERTGLHSAAAIITGSVSPAGTRSARVGELDRRPQTVDALADPGTRGSRVRPRHAEARRVHEASDREQLVGTPSHLRAVLWIWHHHHRGGTHRPHLPRDRVARPICRRGGRALAGVHRRDGKTRRRWPLLPSCGGRSRRVGEALDNLRRAALPHRAPWVGWTR